MPHEQYMHRCFDLARMAGGRPAPNPMVGAVLVHGNRIIGEGLHRRYGSAHAEPDCIDAVLPEDRHLIRESTLYVNLEPCAHHGQTPPCSLRIIQEGIPMVVIANTDPFEKVNGNGITLLRDHGIQVVTGICADEGRWLNRRFFHFHEQQRPYIILKWAETADGYMAPADRTRYTISNPHSHRLVHKWRTEESAIMVGYRTALHDNPRLTARLWKGPQPLRIVLDQRLQLPTAMHLFDEEAPTWIVNELRSSVQGNIRYLQLPFNSELLPALMQELYLHKKLSLLVEGGAALLQRFITGGFWNETRFFTASHTLGTGITAPVLQNAIPLWQTYLADDRLQVLARQDMSFSGAEATGLL